jgi:hypothetical protein
MLRNSTDDLGGSPSILIHPPTYQDLYIAITQKSFKFPTQESHNIQIFFPVLILGARRIKSKCLFHLFLTLKPCKCKVL